VEARRLAVIRWNRRDREAHFAALEWTTLPAQLELTPLLPGDLIVIILLGELRLKALVHFIFKMSFANLRVQMAVLGLELAEVALWS
jgi:hypothetical protein